MVPKHHNVIHQLFYIGSKIAISIVASRLALGGLGGLGLGGHMNWAAAKNFASLKRATILKVQS